MRSFPIDFAFLKYYTVSAVADLDVLETKV